MPQDRESKSTVSAEVIGVLSSLQEAELRVFALTIFQALKLDPKVPENIDRVKAVVADCVFRGLEDEGRIWLKPNEEAARYFSIGLKQREKIASTANRILGSSGNDLFITRDEFRSSVSPFEEDLSDVEGMITNFKMRKRAVRMLQNKLFVLSPLSDEVQALSDEMIPPAIEIDDAYNRFFANLIVSMALYKKIGVQVEPEDLVALGDLWKDVFVRQKAEEDIVQGLTTLARDLRINQGAMAIEIYTRNLFARIADLLANRIDLNALRSSNDFAINGQAFKQEGRGIVVRHTMVRESEVQSARKRFGELVKAAKDYEEGLLRFNDDDIPKDYGEEYINLLKSLEPLDFVIALAKVEGNTINEQDKEISFRLKEDLTLDIPPETFLNGLNIVCAPPLIAETGQEIQELQDKKLVQQLCEIIKNKVIDAVLDDSLAFEQVVKILPAGVLVDLLDIVDVGSFSEATRQAILEIDDDVWVSMCETRGVESDFLGDGFRFEDNSGNLDAYLRMLPTERQMRIARKLQKIVEL